MAVKLSAGQRDKAVFALRDAAKTMFGDPRRMEYNDVDELQTILAGHGLQLAPLAAVLPPPPAPAAAVPASPAATTPTAALNTNELGWLETLVQMYRQYKGESRTGYVLNMDQLGRLLTYTCRLAGIKFTK